MSPNEVRRKIELHYNTLENNVRILKRVYREAPKLFKTLIDPKLKMTISEQVVWTLTKVALGAVPGGGIMVSLGTAAAELVYADYIDAKTTDLTPRSSRSTRP